MPNYKYESFPRFVPDTHKGCKGHAIHFLDCEYSEEADRQVMISILDREIAKIDDELNNQGKIR